MIGKLELTDFFLLIRLIFLDHGVLDDLLASNLNLLVVALLLWLFLLLTWFRVFVFLAAQDHGRIIQQMQLWNLWIGSKLSRLLLSLNGRLDLIGFHDGFLLVLGGLRRTLILEMLRRFAL